jgi:hypothetical protein
MDTTMNTMATTMLTRIMPTTTILTMVKTTIAHKARLVTSHSPAPTKHPGRGRPRASDGNLAPMVEVLEMNY